MAGKKKDDLIDTGTPAPVTAAPPAPTTVRLKNRGKRSLTCNLACKEYCVDVCTCSKVEQVVDVFQPATGQHQKQLLERRICQSVTWSGGETRVLAASAVKCPEVARALRQKILISL